MARNGRAPKPNNGCCLQVALIDLDDTVYPRGSGLMEEVGRRITRYLIERMRIPEAQALLLRRRYYEAYGTTLRGLQVHHQVDTEDYLHFVHDIPLERYLRPDPALDDALGRVRQQKVIFTNATREHAEKVLRLMGLSHHFRRIIDVRALQFINKPDERAYYQALALVGVPPEACLVVEDSARNLRPACDLGMATVLVSPDGEPADRVDVVIPTLAHLPNALQRLEEGAAPENEKR